MKRAAILLSIFIIMIFLLSGCGKDETEAKNIEQIYKEEGVPVRTKKIELKLFETELSYNSVLTGIEESSAYAMVGDKVERIYVSVGDYVKKDAVLLSFPTDNPSAKYYQAKVAFENARKAFERMENLYSSGGISLQNLDNSKAAYEVAKANWEASSQTVKVRAPISGYVTKVNVRETDNVEREDELFTISRTNKMKSKVWVTEKEIGDVKKGLLAEAVWNALKIKGKVVQVDMAMNQVTQAFGAVLEFENPDNTLKCGITAIVNIKNYRNPQAAAIEIKNILKDKDQYYVYVVKDGLAERRNIIQGRRQGLHAEIVEGLNPGDELIVEGQMLLEPGGKVKIIK
ncbi:MAG: efflux RND transporter periplasmic adaptor subunit [Calditrichales bacterium]|nr:efflux RND transporter periplasmic adaptor subunit [Calditrichales bacterium]